MALIPKAQAAEGVTGTLDFSKIKIFSVSNNTVSSEKVVCKMGGDICRSFI